MAKKIIEPNVLEIVENIHNETMEEIMGSRYATYAKYVIQDRAIPDARDGLKPVQRRIIYSMYKDGNIFSRPTKKCAHTVGAVMGKYHPHGDSSIYEALVRMSQTWKVNNPLIDFQGNNGSIDGDVAAAYRYTEARLSLIAEEMVRHIDKDTVDMSLTFDDSATEPVVMPSRFPNLLVNGTEGIAVAMATDIPPHNLREVIDAVIYRINHVNVEPIDLMNFIPGPDFPTGGYIYKGQGLVDVYLKGRGRFEIASKTEIIDNKNTKQIIIHEIPYGITKISLVYEIDKLRHDKIITGISEVRDESDREGLRICIDLKKDANVDAIYKYLINKTSLKIGYSPNMVAIVNGSPKTMNILDFVDSYIDHQVDVITRRSEYDLKKSTARLEIVEGLIRTVDIVDEVVTTIRSSKDKADAKVNLQKKFGFTEAQSEAIVMLQLYKLSNTDVTTFIEEKKSLEETIEFLNGILSDRKKLDRLLISDLKEIAKKYGRDRKTIIVDKEDNFMVDKRDLIAKEEVYIAVTRDGYIKHSPVKSYRSSGENPLPGMKEGDALVFAGSAITTDYLICFTNLGNFLHIPVHETMENKWKDEGKHINYLVSLNPNEKIVRAFVVEEFRNDLSIGLVSKFGQVKRVPLASFSVIKYRKAITCMKLLSDDEVVDALFLNGDSNITLFMDNGEANMFNENQVPFASLKSGGVKGLSKMNGGRVVSALAYDSESTRGKVVLLTDKGAIRILDITNVLLTNRLGKHTVIFRSFKSEVHKLVYAVKLDLGIEENLIRMLTSDKTVLEIKVNDYHVTPMDKYAKSSLTIPHKASLEIAFKDAFERITKDMVSKMEIIPESEKEEEENSENDVGSQVSLEINEDSSSELAEETPEVEEEMTEETPVEPKIEKPVKEVKPEPKEEPLPDDIPDVDERGYKQISIFDDFFGDDDE